MKKFIFILFLVVSKNSFATDLLSEFSSPIIFYKVLQTAESENSSEEKYIFYPAKQDSSKYFHLYPFPSAQKIRYAPEIENKSILHVERFIVENDKIIGFETYDFDKFFPGFQKLKKFSPEELFNFVENENLQPPCYTLSEIKSPYKSFEMTFFEPLSNSKFEFQYELKFINDFGYNITTVSEKENHLIFENDIMKISYFDEEIFYYNIQEHILKKKGDNSYQHIEDSILSIRKPTLTNKTFSKEEIFALEKKLIIQMNLYC